MPNITRLENTYLDFDLSSGGWVLIRNQPSAIVEERISTETAREYLKNQGVPVTYNAERLEGMGMIPDAKNIFL